MAQSFELSQFVRHTAHGADVVIITGDFNMEPEDLGLRLIISQVHLVDAWRLAHPVSPQRLCNTYSSPCRGVENGSTCDRPDNCYSSRKFRQKDDSKRLDYILFKNGRMSLCLEMCDVVMNKILDEELNYSDHVGVLAHFIVNNKDRQPSCEWEPNRPLLVEAIAIVSAGQRRARSDRTWFMCGSALLFVTVIASLFLDDFAPFLSVILSVMRVILTLMIAFCVWYGLIGLTLERKALEAAKQAMQQLLND
ncbi:hypothetical protein KIN20_020720 [Parelaphostrongylus tenuis]|uniref:Endonuclease/exonuclease/phosphatase domain-containing protein n=1 Tax=Parelaphostrongylus tenuis TaxID=148309 RepID=A0AAD5MMV6_PARTN|nr:hypothetical protein KIN20_020720 [Parelaphostrongylus tenuis]